MNCQTARRVEFVATVRDLRVSRELTGRLRVTPDRSPQNQPLAQTGSGTPESRSPTDRTDAGDSDGIERQCCHARRRSGANPGSNGGVRSESCAEALQARRPPGASRQVHGGRTNAARTLSEGSYASLYQIWLRSTRSRRPDCGDAETDPASFAYRPLVSVVTPVYNTDARWLRACIESVKSQAYPNWQLCLADDGSTRAETRALLREYEGDPRIKIKMLATNGGIAAASNEALTLARGGIRRVSRPRRRAHAGRAVRGSRASERSTRTRTSSTRTRTSSSSTAHGATRTSKPDWSPEHLPDQHVHLPPDGGAHARCSRLGGFRPATKGLRTTTWSCG